MVRLEEEGHMTKAPAIIMYASVMSRETVRKALMTAGLNDLEVKLGNIWNAYITCYRKGVDLFGS